MGHFNPRSLTGATSVSVTDTEVKTVFQSTLPHGSDAYLHNIVNIFRNFNPRSLTGATAFLEVLQRRMHISIHAPSRERLNKKELITIATEISIHAPSRERQLSFNSCSSHGKISIHAPSRERLQGVIYDTLLLEFQSTLPHGSDQRYFSHVFHPLYISIHAPSRERPRERLRIGY